MLRSRLTVSKPYTGGHDACLIINVIKTLVDIDLYWTKTFEKRLGDSRDNFRCALRRCRGKQNTCVKSGLLFRTGPKMCGRRE